MPPLAYLAAKAIMAMIFSAILVVSLFVIGTAFGGVHLSLGRFLGLAMAMIVGTIPFCALGLMIGCYSAPNSAPAVVNVLFLPLAFCSGLWLPIQLLPKVLQRIAPFLPPYHLGHWLYNRVGFAGAGHPIQHVAALAALYRGISFACWRRFQSAMMWPQCLKMDDSCPATGR